MFRGNEIPTGNRPIRVLSALRTKRGRSGRNSRAAFPVCALPSLVRKVGLYAGAIAKSRPISRTTQKGTKDLCGCILQIVAETASQRRVNRCFPICGQRQIGSWRSYHGGRMGEAHFASSLARLGADDCSWLRPLCRRRHLPNPRRAPAFSSVIKATTGFKWLGRAP